MSAVPSPDLLDPAPPLVRRQGMRRSTVEASRLATASFVLLAGCIHVAAQCWALLANPAPLRYFHTFVAGDQLGYLAISADVAQGRLDRFEPYTETGVNSYPRGYYTAIGLVARLLHVAPVTAWNLVAIVLQVVMVAVVALLVVQLTRRPWTALAVPVVFLAGPFAWIFQPGQWRIIFDSHSTLWGPYGVNAPLNAETAGLAFGATALGLLGLAWLVPRSPRARLVLTIVAALIIGGSANGQTYSFLSIVYVVAALVGTATLVAGRRWLLLGLSGVLIGVVYLVGPVVAGAAGQLPTLVFGLLPFVPGVLVLAVQAGRWVWMIVALVAAAALPQLWTTISDVRAADPFLLYRVVSNKDLGVDFWQAVLSGGAVLIPLLCLLGLGLVRRQPVLIAIGGAVPVVWLYLMTNDVWGANAEPYRFWIELLHLGGVTLLIGIALVFAPASNLSTPAAPRRAPTTTISRRQGVAVAGIWLALVALSLPDYVRWATDPLVQQVWNTGTSRMRALDVTSTRATGGGLVLTDICINPQSVKTLSAVPVAYYRMGMAWPKDRAAVDAALRARKTQLTTPVAARAGVRWILTDSSCSTAWLAPVRSHLVKTQSAVWNPEPGYEGGAGVGHGVHRITLWRLSS